MQVGSTYRILQKDPQDSSDKKRQPKDPLLWVLFENGDVVRGYQKLIWLPTPSLLHPRPKSPLSFLNYWNY